MSKERFCFCFFSTNKQKKGHHVRLQHAQPQNKLCKGKGRHFYAQKKKKRKPSECACTPRPPSSWKLNTFITFLQTTAHFFPLYLCQADAPFTLCSNSWKQVVFCFVLFLSPLQVWGNSWGFSLPRRVSRGAGPRKTRQHPCRRGCAPWRGGKREGRTTDGRRDRRTQRKLEEVNFFVVTPIFSPPRTCLRLQMELNVNDLGLLISLRSRFPPGREFVRNLRRRFAPQPLLEGLKS